MAHRIPVDEDFADEDFWILCMRPQATDDMMEQVTDHRIMLEAQSKRRAGWFGPLENFAGPGPLMGMSIGVVAGCRLGRWDDWRALILDEFL